MGDELRLDEKTARTVVRRFSKAGEELEGARMDVKPLRTSIEDACGEFSRSISTGADEFEISWSEFFDVAGDSARIIAQRTNQAHEDLVKLDQKHTPGN